MTEDTQFANHKSRTLDKLSVTTTETIANSAYKASETKPVLEKVELKPKPELDTSIGFFEAFFANLQLFWRQNIAKYFKGEEISNPLSFVSVLTNWKWLAIWAAVFGVLYLLLRYIL